MAAPPPPSGDDTTQQDGAKSIAIPIFAIIAIILAGFMTRTQFSSAFTNCRSDPRLAVMFFGSCLCVFFSIFLFPSAAWEYGVISVVLSYVFSLMCNPGLMEQYANQIFGLCWGWFLILVGIPDQWNDGIIAASTSEQCQKWYPSKTDTMCKSGWLTFVMICSILTIIINLFCLVCVISFVFEGSQSTLSADAGNMRFGATASGADGSYEPVGEYQAVGGEGGSLA